MRKISKIIFIVAISIIFTNNVDAKVKQVVNITSPNSRVTYYTDQEVKVKWKSTGFNKSFRESDLYLVRKDGTTYTTLYSFGGGMDRWNYATAKIPRGLKDGSNYAFKIVLHNADNQNAVDYSDKTFSIKSKTKSTCTDPSVNIEVAPTFNTNGGFGLLGDYLVSVGGGDDCIARISKIQFKANTKVNSWHTQYTDMTTSIDGNILTLTQTEPLMTLSGEMVNVPDQLNAPDASGRASVKTYKKQPSKQYINVWGDFYTANNVTSFIDPISIEAVDINGEKITNIFGLKK